MAAEPVAVGGGSSVFSTVRMPGAFVQPGYKGTTLVFVSDGGEGDGGALPTRLVVSWAKWSSLENIFSKRKAALLRCRWVGATFQCAWFTGTLCGHAGDSLLVDTRGFAHTPHVPNFLVSRDGGSPQLSVGPWRFVHALPLAASAYWKHLRLHGNDSARRYCALRWEEEAAAGGEATRHSNAAHQQGKEAKKKRKAKQKEEAEAGRRRWKVDDGGPLPNPRDTVRFSVYYMKRHSGELLVHPPAGAAQPAASAPTLAQQYDDGQENVTPQPTGAAGMPLLLFGEHSRQARAVPRSRGKTMFGQSMKRDTAYCALMLHGQMHLAELDDDDDAPPSPRSSDAGILRRISSYYVLTPE